MIAVAYAGTMLRAHSWKRTIEPLYALIVEKEGLPSWGSRPGFGN